MRTYKVIHFLPRLTGGVFGAKGEPIETQLNKVISQQATEGWDFVSYQTAHALVKAGCLSALLGRKDEVIFYDILIFAK